MTVLIRTPIGLVQTCTLNESGLLVNTSVPASVAIQIEDAIIRLKQRSGVAVYEDEDIHGPYKYEFPWEVQIS